MGWAYCGTDQYDREIGYGIAATCDKRGCGVAITRGLAYCCGPMHNGDEGGCGRYYCDAHLGGYGPRGGCSHRGKKAWGKTFCQVLFNDMTRVTEDKFWCACREWKVMVPAGAYSLDRWREIPGYLDHLAASGQVPETQESGEDPLRA